MQEDNAAIDEAIILTISPAYIGNEGKAKNQGENYLPPVAGCAIT
jgi:hypothetical protein